MNHDTTPSPEDSPHAHCVDAVVAALDGDPAEGLSETTVRERRERFGANCIPEPGRRGPVARFLSQFNDALIYILLIAALVTALLQHWVDTVAIMGVVVINAIIGFVQEGRAESAMAAVRGLLSRRANVWRNGERRTVPAEDLVPGDIVQLAPGDKVPADLRLITVRNLRVDESPLTGESEPVDKSTTPVAADAALADRNCLALSGTLVRYGEGSGVVVATGAETAIGAMSTMLGGVRHVETPLARQVRRFGHRLSGAIVVLALGVFALAVTVREFAWIDAFLASVGLAVAAIPQGLPAIMTITLAAGVRAMARRRGIVRRMHAAETLGSVTTICSDKTGTLTRNEMSAVAVALPGDEVTVTGSGYAPNGHFERAGQTVAPDAVAGLQALARAAALCNDARLTPETDEEWTLDGDPTEGALLTLAHKADLDPRREQKAWPRRDALPFSSEQRYMATLHHAGDGGCWIYLKGAPERVIAMADSVATAQGTSAIDRQAWQAHVESLANSGQRVLALARKGLTTPPSALTPTDAENGLELLGLVGLLDPPRAEAVQAVAECQRAGMRVKMITGDHILTARAIGARMGIGDGEAVLSGQDIDDYDDDTLAAQAIKVDVFARVSPQHKLRLVEALQSQDQVVAMTGDGVNDAAALKRADVGVAMGNKGTEVACESADIVLTDDNFASIAAAVQVGRNAYDNIKRSVLFLLPTNGGEALAIIAAVILGLQLPITPVQILWVNMVTAATLGLALAFEPGRSDVMQRPPRPPGEPLVTRGLIGRIALVATLMLVGTLAAFVTLQALGASLTLARTTAVNVLVLFEVFYLFNARLLSQPLRSWRDLTGNGAAWLSIAVVITLQMAFTYAPPMQWLFETTAMPLHYWFWIVPITAVVIPAVEIEKAVHRRRRSYARSAPATSRV